MNIVALSGERKVFEQLKLFRLHGANVEFLISICVLVLHEKINMWKNDGYYAVLKNYFIPKRMAQAICKLC
jgi:hypothetical protein